MKWYTPLIIGVAVAVVAIAATDKKIPQLPAIGSLSDPDLVYVVSGGADYKATIAQFRALSTGGTFSGSTTNLTNNGSFTVPSQEFTNAGYPMLVGFALPHKTYTANGLMYNPSIGLYSVYGFMGSGAKLSQLDGRAMIDGTVSATFWRNEAANKIFVGPSSGADAKPTFRTMVSDDIPAQLIQLSHLAPSTISALTNAGGGTNYFIANGTNFLTVNQTNIGTLTMTDGSGNYVYIDVANGFSAPNANIRAATVTLASPTVPVTAVDTGLPGQLAWDSSYFYVAVGTNTWKRVALSSW